MIFISDEPENGTCEACGQQSEQLKPVSDGTESGEFDWLCEACRGDLWECTDCGQRRPSSESTCGCGQSQSVRVQDPPNREIIGGTDVSAASPKPTRTAALAGNGEARATSELPGGDGNRYPGGKGQAGLCEWIVDYLPAHVFYAEPFAGKGGIFRNKLPALRSYLVDADVEICDWWSRQDLPGAIVIHGDGIRFCELAAEWGPSDLLIYCDPPYLPETRTKRNLYRHEMAAEDHVRLLKALTALRGPCLVSGYWSDLYAARLERKAGWSCVTRDVQTRWGGMRTECLWINPAARLPASSEVTMRYRDYGTCWRERDRVKRKVERWTGKLKELPRRERRAILLGLLEEERAKGLYQDWSWRERDRIKRKVRRWSGQFRGLPHRERQAILLGLLSADQSAGIVTSDVERSRSTSGGNGEAAGRLDGRGEEVLHGGTDDEDLIVESGDASRNRGRGPGTRAAIVKPDAGGSR